MDKKNIKKKRMRFLELKNVSFLLLKNNEN